MLFPLWLLSVASHRAHLYSKGQRALGIFPPSGSLTLMFYLSEPLCTPRPLSCKYSFLKSKWALKGEAENHCRLWQSVEAQWVKVKSYLQEYPQSPWYQQPQEFQAPPVEESSISTHPIYQSLYRTSYRKDTYIYIHTYIFLKQTFSIGFIYALVSYFIWFDLRH